MEGTKVKERDPELIEVQDSTKKPAAETVKKEELSEEVRFNILRGWSKENGVLGLENIQLPAKFTDDFSPVDRNFAINGVAAKRDIHHREAILAVPFDLLVSPQTFKE